MKTTAIVISTLLLGAFFLVQSTFLHFTGTSTSKDGKEMKSRPNEWFYLQRAYPTGRINKQAHLNAVRQAQTMQALRKGGVEAEWKVIGPTNIGGRITALAVHPLLPNVIYIGAAAGGVWKSVDQGATWTPIFDEQVSQSIGAMAIDPVNPDIVYVGTGEANGSGDSYAGDGVYKSEDGGQSWIHLGLEESDHIGRIAIDPRNTDVVYVAACGQLFGKNDERGVYKSTNGGTTWERSLFISDSTAAIDVALNPRQPDTLYAATWERVRSPSRRKVGGFTSGIYRSFDGGESWTLLENGLPPAGPNIGRIGLAVAPSAPETIYAIYADDPGNFFGVFRSADHGESWERTNDNSLVSLFSNFGWYFGNLKVDPSDGEVVYALGVGFYKTTDGGDTWQSILRSIHVDQHAIDFDPYNSQHIFVGNDGGFYASTNGGNGWAKSINLPITQFYAGTIDFLNPQRTYGGTQDNGTLRTMTGNSGDWEEMFGGDGFYVVVDYTDSRYVYAESQFGGLGRSIDGGSSFRNATNGIDPSDRRNWSCPLVIDPQKPSVLYFGTNKLYRSTNRAVNWSPISDDLTSGIRPANLVYATLTTISVSPVDSNVIYVGSDDANVWVTTDLGESWRDVSNGLPNRWVTRVAADPYDVNVAYVTFSGHAEDVFLPHIFRTTDQGQSWTDISSNLPEGPINVVAIDTDSSNTLYVGTDVGVFYTTSLGDFWQPLGAGMPLTPVHDLTLHPITRQLRAATHGRSFYEFDLNAIVSQVSEQVEARPETFALRQNYPNPISASSAGSRTTITVEVLRPGEARLEVFDMLGRSVATVYRGALTSGKHRLQFDASNLPAGTYAYRLSLTDEAGQQHMQSRVMTIVR